jgi:hypothetical protein
MIALKELFNRVLLVKNTSESSLLLIVQLLFIIIVFSTSCDPNPCNGNSCTQLLQNIECNCQSGQLGNYCSYTESDIPELKKAYNNLISSIIDQTNLKKPLEISKIQQLIELSAIEKQKSGFLSKEMINDLTAITRIISLIFSKTN